MPSLSAQAKPKTMVSIRLPRDIVDAVAAFAESRQMTKTQAYEHFLRVALNGGDALQLKQISSKLDSVLSLLKRENPDANDERDDVIGAIGTVLERFPAVDRAYLFGSFARGTFDSDSDVDIRLEIDRRKSFNLHDVAQCSKQIEQLTGRSVDLVTAAVIKNGQLAEAIERDGVLIYEREE